MMTCPARHSAWLPLDREYLGACGSRCSQILTIWKPQTVRATVVVALTCVVGYRSESRKSAPFSNSSPSSRRPCSVASRSPACHSGVQNHAWLRSIVASGRRITSPFSVTSASMRSPSCSLAALSGSGQPRHQRVEPDPHPDRHRLRVEALALDGVNVQHHRAIDAPVQQREPLRERAGWPCHVTA